MRRGCEFIPLDEPGKERVHHTGIVVGGGHCSLAEGTRVSYEVEFGGKGAKAVKVKPAVARER